MRKYKTTIKKAAVAVILSAAMFASFPEGVYAGTEGGADERNTLSGLVTKEDAQKFRSESAEVTQDGEIITTTPGGTQTVGNGDELTAPLNTGKNGKTTESTEERKSVITDRAADGTTIAADGTLTFQTVEGIWQSDDLPISVGYQKEKDGEHAENDTGEYKEDTVSYPLICTDGVLSAYSVKRIWESQDMEIKTDGVTAEDGEFSSVSGTFDGRAKASVKTNEASGTQTTGTDELAAGDRAEDGTSAEENGKDEGIPSAEIVETGTGSIQTIGMDDPLTQDKTEAADDYAENTENTGTTIHVQAGDDVIISSDGTLTFKTLSWERLLQDMDHAMSQEKEKNGSKAEETGTYDGQAEAIVEENGSRGTQNVGIDDPMRQQDEPNGESSDEKGSYDGMDDAAITKTDTSGTENIGRNESMQQKTVENGTGSETDGSYDGKGETEITQTDHSGTQDVGMDETVRKKDAEDGTVPDTDGTYKGDAEAEVKGNTDGNRMTVSDMDEPMTQETAEDGSRAEEYGTYNGTDAMISSDGVLTIARITSVWDSVPYAETLDAFTGRYSASYAERTVAGAEDEDDRNAVPSEETEGTGKQDIPSSEEEVKTEGVFMQSAVGTEPVTLKAYQKTFDDSDKVSITIRYFDDEEEKRPVKGAEFTIYRIGTIDTSIIDDAGTALTLDRQASANEKAQQKRAAESVGSVIIDSGYYKSLINGFTISGKTTARMAQEAALEYYAGAVPNHTEGVYKGKTNRKGILTFKNLPKGLYVGIETDPVRWHLASTGFFVSAPEAVTEVGKVSGGNSYWNFNIKVEPKPVIAGDLVIGKTVNGAKTVNGTYHVRINLQDKDVFGDELEYKAILPDGTSSTVKSGDVIEIKKGQKLKIKDVPAGSDYTVEEMEADRNGFDTSYLNQNGKIKAKNKTKVTVVNTKRPLFERVQTGDTSLLPYLIVLLAAITAIIVIIAVQKKKKDKQKENTEKTEEKH